MKPRRIQRKRTKGWKMPPNTVYVGRPSKWGNPFVTGLDGRRARCVELFKLMLAGYICLSGKPGIAEKQVAYLKMVKRDRRHLHGRNLACWCPLDQPCHADVLLEIANQ